MKKLNEELDLDPDMEFINSINDNYDGDDDADEKIKDNFQETDGKEIEKIKSDLNPDAGGPIRTDNINTRSKLDAGTSIQVLKIVRKALEKYDCVLNDWKIKFHNEGFDMTNILIKTRNVSNLMSKVNKKQLVDFRNKPTALALIIVSNEIVQKCSDELALKAKVYVYKGADIGSITIVNEEPEETMDEFAAIDPSLEAMAMDSPIGPGGDEEPLSGDLAATGDIGLGIGDELEETPEETPEEVVPEETPEETERLEEPDEPDEDIDAAIKDLS